MISHHNSETQAQYDFWHTGEARLQVAEATRLKIEWKGKVTTPNFEWCRMTCIRLSSDVTGVRLSTYYWTSAPWDCYLVNGTSKSSLAEDDVSIIAAETMQ